MDRGGENKEGHSKQWQLQPESEYRFELDPGKSLAIKVCCPCSACASSLRCTNGVYSAFFVRLSQVVNSSFVDMPRYSERNWRRARHTCSARNARQPCTPGKAAP